LHQRVLRKTSLHYCLAGTKSVDPLEFYRPPAANASSRTDRGGEWRVDNETGVVSFSTGVRYWPTVHRMSPATGDTRREHPPTGSLARGLLAEQPFPCPLGHYCRSGVASSVPIPKNFSSPQRCFNGFFCPAGSSTPEGSGPCPTGHFCPTQTEAYICPRGQYCPGVGNTKPVDCYPGTYNPDLGRSNCTLCPTGHICPGWRRTAPEVCPAGFVCIDLGLSAPALLCPAGYFCREGTLTLNPSDTTPLRPMPCAAGTFCLAGVAHNLTIDWIPTRPEAATAPQTCTEGTFCELGSSSPAGSGPCFPGHYCPPGSVYPTESPVGRFAAKNGSVAPTLCFPGTYAPLRSTVQCRVCPAGYQCSGYGTYEPSICEAGTYRSLADSVSCRLCPQGSWSVLPGVTDVSMCEPCPAGRVCGKQKMSSLDQSTPCPKGFVCSEGTTRALQFAHKCPAGYFCAEDTPPEDQFSFMCDAGYFCSRGTRDDQKLRNKCPVGFFCPPGTGSGSPKETRCPRGTTSLSGQSDLAKCTVEQVNVCDKKEGVSYLPSFEYTLMGNIQRRIPIGNFETPILKKIMPVNLSSSTPMWVNDTVESFRACPTNGTDKGGTEVTIIGRNFRQSPLLVCRFRPYGSTFTVNMPAVFESKTRVRCLTPPYRFSERGGAADADGYGVAQIDVSNNARRSARPTPTTPTCATTSSPGASPTARGCARTTRGCCAPRSSRAWPPGTTTRR
jgi:hypothetical protein